MAPIMEIPTPPFAKSYLTKFKIEDVLRPDDPMTVPLLRLMIATDDLRHLQKLLVIVREVDETSTESDRLIHNGEIGHLFRLICGHLYEAATPFRAVDEAARGRLDKAVAEDPEGKAALAAVRAAYDPNRTDGLRHSFLYLVRNEIAFHYKDQDLRTSFEKHLREGHLLDILVLAEGSGLSRFSLTDSLLTFTIADGMGERLEDFAQQFMTRIGEAIGLVGDIATVVGHLLGYLLAPHRKAVEMREDQVTIDPALRAARDQIERERRKAKAV
ncbi:MAG: hypothetical protein DMF95_31690 [Acidobacteria bacterium]|nr:MAG: hypothetical protein DMF95_31690 [Acidobacteriota bacterium]